MRRRGGLEFPHTCPTIDKALNDIEFDVDRVVDDVLSGDYANAKMSLHINLCHGVMDAISQAVEKVRTSNQDIREVAEKQIVELMDELSEAAVEIDDRQKTIDQLESTISDLDEDLEYYKTGYFKLEKENNELVDKLYEYK